MTKSQAQRLMEDLGKNLVSSDYKDNVYISIKNVGTKIFRECAYHETDGYTFIWTKSERFIINKKEVGGYVVVPYTHDSHLSTKVT